MSEEPALQSVGESSEVKAVDESELEPLIPAEDIPKPQRSPGRRMSLQMQATANLRLNAATDFTDVGITGRELLKVSKAIDQEYIEAIRSRDNKEDFALSDVLGFLNSGVSVAVEDDFSVCFERGDRRSWNWNFYLFILWIVGLVFRYLILFPIRLIVKLLGLVLTTSLLWLWGQLYKDNPEKKEAWELWTLQLLCKIWVTAWTGVIEYKGVIPKKRPNQIYVANHSTMLDWLLLMQMHPFCVVGQLHATSPFIAWFQLELLKSLHCIWFNRKETKDRTLAAQRIKDHIADPNSPRLLIFPEGTCVNNEYCIQFKRGSFAMDAEMCPIAIKYNKTFCDAYWISRARPFHWHIFDIMTSWAMVAEVHYLEPQKIRENETATEFSSRVKAMIAKAAGLKDVQWNGYLKHYKQSERVINESKKLFSERLLRKLDANQLSDKDGLRQRNIH